MDSSLQAWALPRIRRLLPLDDDSLVEVLTYSTTLTKSEAAEHLTNLLGDSPAALEFISSFSSRRKDTSPAAPVSLRADAESEGVPRSRKQGAKQSKPPLHVAGPVRRPEGYGDLGSGYQKYASPDALHLPKVTQGGRASPNNGLSRDASPMGSPARLPPSAAGSMISDFMPNVRSKQSKPKHHLPQPSLSQPQSGTSTPNLRPSSNSKGSTTTSSISDLTSAIAALEMSTNPTLSSSAPRKCNCNATLHPLFAPAPNCLSCGKIICSLEGLQQCSFCGSAILTNEEIQSMISQLKNERGQERTAYHNAGVASNRSGTGTPKFGAMTPDSGGSGDEAATRARAHRDKLLGFQSQNAQRTKIHDEAADFDAGLDGGKGMQWMSAVQRAAALKKQQKYLREMEEANRPEWEREKTVVSLSMKGGKLVKTFRKEKAPSGTQVEDDEDVDGEGDAGVGAANGTGGKGGSFSNNPLLKGGGLIRPIWNAPEGDAKGKGKAEESSRERKSAWRRVQDDNKDNEQFILDGGLRGYGTETRIMEDGSQQERG